MRRLSRKCLLSFTYIGVFFLLYACYSAVVAVLGFGFGTVATTLLSEHVYGGPVSVCIIASMNLSIIPLGTRAALSLCLVIAYFASLFALGQVSSISFPCVS